jgi:hypothetical protein
MHVFGRDNAVARENQGCRYSFIGFAVTTRTYEIVPELQFNIVVGGVQNELCRIRFQASFKKIYGLEVTPFVA